MMVKILDILEVYDHVTLAQLYTERAKILIQEVMQDFLYPADKGKPYTIYDVHRARLKSEMLDEALDALKDELLELEKMSDQNGDTEAEPSTDHQEAEARAYIVDEYLNRINAYVDIIEDKPDFIRRMGILEALAQSLAKDRTTETAPR